MSVATRQHHVRVNEETHRLLRELSTDTGDSMTSLIAKAVEAYRREFIFAVAERQWAAIQADPEARQELEAEFAWWDGTIADGLEPEEW